MSFEYYTKWWIKSRKDLETLTQQDEKARDKFKQTKDRNLTRDLIGGLYAKYCMLVQNLITCLDQLAQPQKRSTIKKIVDSAVIRLNELHDALRNIDISEYHYIDGNLIELKLVPYDVEILNPRIFHHRPLDIEDMLQEFKKGTTVLTKIPEDATFQDEKVFPDEGDTKVIFKTTKMSEIQKTVAFANESHEKIDQKNIKYFINLIQTAERARQARVYFFEKNLNLKRRKKLMMLGADIIPPAPLALQTVAATKIQKLWRGYRSRKYLKYREDQRRLLIGMTESSCKSKREFEIFEENLENRRRYGQQKIREYIQAIDREKARILRVVAPGLFEDIEDEIREWFRRWFSIAKTFDNYPSEEKGGTILLVRGETLTPEEYMEEYERKRREQIKSGGKDNQRKKNEREQKTKEEKKKSENKRKKEASKTKKKHPGEFEYQFDESLSKDLRKLGEEEYKVLWSERNERDNPEENPYVDLITEQQCYETQLEVRKAVDEIMRMELDVLQEALAFDKRKKYKKKKVKRRKGKKKGKKDPTAHRTVEDLFHELVSNKIIRTYPVAKLDEFKGDFSYKNSELRQIELDPPGALLDVRQAIALNCILPLGVEAMKKPRSVLIAGPKHSGKHFLANAILTHTQSVLFDLSPEITADKYPGNKGLTMLIHLVTKMSKLLQPSIIFFDGAEKIYYKKVPNHEKHLEPKRIGKRLVKGIVKTIKPEDRVLVLGITDVPWLAQTGRLRNAFERVILIPRPDYNSVYLFWRDFLNAFPSVDRNFNYTALATVTTYYPYKVLKEVVERVLTPRRIIQLKFNPLKAEEFYEILVSERIEPITDKEYQKFTKWYAKTSLGRERAQFNKWVESKRDAEAKANEKQQKGRR
ncbi:dynein regulatory complex protein 11-like [Cylas formicarius]|uniref:dynein regulatory complex protein 11-like n=1 Tax=Cylas formicarius TaxID=197179 RepID=UPI002958CDE8|nr:dynein regulatory complex protein 11-like [Cylas formicarius]